MGNKLLILIFLPISFILLNIFSRFIYEQNWFGTFGIQKEVNPFDIISLLITSVVTYFIAVSVTKRLANHRYYKDYLIEDLKQIEIEINKLEANLISNNIDLQVVIEKMTTISISIYKFKKTVEIFNLKKIDVKAVEDQYKKLYQVSTNTEGVYLEINEVINKELKTISSDLIIAIRRQIAIINKN